MATRVLLRERPNRAIAIAGSSHALIFRHSSSPSSQQGGNGSSTSLHASTAAASGNQKCVVELAAAEKEVLRDYRSIVPSVHGTLGMITVDNDVFLCVVSGAAKVATVRPGETINKILAVDFLCLNRADYDHVHDDLSSLPPDMIDDDGFEIEGRRDASVEHPCLQLSKLLSGDNPVFEFDSFDKGYLWNSYMIRPLLDFRTRLSADERRILDSTRLLTSAIRGFAFTMEIPAPSSPARPSKTGFPSTLTLISRLSCRRAGTRFNARGIDDDGNVANFVETETLYWSPSGISFSYAQVRGSVPIFWEQAAGLLPGQQKIQITRSPQATQPAFDKHFEEMELKYGPIHVVNLLSKERSGEVELSQRFHEHIIHSSLNDRQAANAASEHQFVRETTYDFHAETRGPVGYEAASGIADYLRNSAESFMCCVTEETDEKAAEALGAVASATQVLQQTGVFRTNCLDCLDRTNLVQTILSQLALDIWLDPRGEKLTADFKVRHGTLWADNGDALSHIYAGTGALKSSFTRHGKMSLAGALSDVRKSAQRAYINNFADKGRQNTIDMLLGRLLGQTPVYLFDPINDFVTGELGRRAAEFTSSKDISIWTGTFNLNGRIDGINAALEPWLCAPVEKMAQLPLIVAVGFQEIVELSPQQIMSTEPTRRQAWEKAVLHTLNENARHRDSDKYVLLRGGQLVGASLSIFVKSGVLPHIKNVEGSLKKTGLSGVAGNKGAVAIRMDIDNTSLCFVTAHLAAGFANYDERNRDYRTISHGLRFQRNRSIDDHDAVIWLGDFNYRIGLSNERARQLALQGDLEQLYLNDQLNIQMVRGLTFPYYAEARITFLPTYKYDLGSDTFDTSEKARIPAWTDRILRKGNVLRQLDYGSAPLRFSDHRPVYATFSCTVAVIDAAQRDALSRAIYAARREVLEGAAATTDVSDDDDLLGYEPIEPSLPPASSSARKWWLDGGLPARSTVRPPAEGYVPNADRPSNPFTPSSEPDWKPGPILRLQGGARNPSTQSVASTASASSKTSSVVRAPPPPPEQEAMPRKAVAPPPVPRKPAALNSPKTQAAAPASVGAGAPPPMPPRRTDEVVQPEGPRRPGGGTGGNAGLMDEADGDALAGWEPLKPS